MCFIVLLCKSDNFIEYELKTDYYAYVLKDGKKLYVKVNSNGYPHIRMNKNDKDDSKLRLQLIPIRHVFFNCKIQTARHPNRYFNTSFKYLHQEKSARSWKIDCRIPKAVSEGTNLGKIADQDIEVTLTTCASDQHLFEDMGAFYVVSFDNNGWMRIIKSDNADNRSDMYLEKC